MSMNLRVKSVLTLSTALGAVAMIPTAAQAQESEARASTSIQDIVVTARRVEERLQDVPISVTVFNQEQLAKQNVTNMTDLALYTPSLGSTNVLGNAQTTFSLRGFNQELTTAATVGVFFGDVVAPRGASNQQPSGDGAGPGSFFDLQNVQVLKGPQGTLFGRNTTGGAILLVPQKPTGAFEGYVEGSYGNYDMKRVQAVVNVPFGDSVRFRAGVDRQTRDGYVKNRGPIGPRDFNDIDYVAARASLVIDLTPNLETYFIGSYTRSDTQGEVNGIIDAQQQPDLTFPAGVLAPVAVTIPGPLVVPIPGVTPPGTVVGAFPFLARAELNRYANSGFYSFTNNKNDPRSMLDQWQIINNTTWRASDNLTIKNIISYAQLTYDLVNPVYGNGFDLSDFNPYGQAFMNQVVNSRLPAGAPPIVFQPYAPGSILNFTEADPRALGHTSHQSTFTEELQFQGSFGDKTIWQGGFYFEDSQPLSEVGSISGNLAYCPTNSQPLACANPFFGFGSVGLTASKKKIRTIGVYGQASYSITDTLKVTGGLRYTWDQQSVTGRLIAYTVPFNPANPFQVTPVNTTFVNTAPAGFPTNAARCTLPSGSVANGCYETVSQKSDAPTWLLGLDWKPADDILAYAKWARGYRTGGVSFQLPQVLRTYDPEKVNTYEVGFKASWSGAVRGLLNVAAFYNDFQNQQIPVPVSPRVSGQGANATGVVNAGKSEIYGLEVEASIQPFTGFVLSGSYSYLHTEIKELAYPDAQLGGDPTYFLDLSRVPRVGDSLPFAAKNKVSLTANYTLPLPESVGEISLGATYTHSDAQIGNYNFRNASGQLTGYSLLQPRDLLDLNATWKGIAGMPIDLSVFANNVTKQKYYTYILDVSVNAQSAQLGLPRMYGLRLRYSFGK